MCHSAVCAIFPLYETLHDRLFSVTSGEPQNHLTFLTGYPSTKRQDGGMQLWSDVTPYFAHQLSAKWVLKTAKPLELQPWPCTVVTEVATVILIDRRRFWAAGTTPCPSFSRADDVIHPCCEVKGRATPD